MEPLDLDSKLHKMLHLTWTVWPGVEFGGSTGSHEGGVECAGSQPKYAPRLDFGRFFGGKDGLTVDLAL